jgi:hypothetical protein
MDQITLVGELVEAGSRFLDEFGKHYPIAIAFWLKARDERGWNLHIASEEIGDAKIREAYGEVLRSAAQVKDVFFDPFDVVLRKMDDPIVQFALDSQRGFPARRAMLSNVPSFGGIEIEAIYLYPPLKTAAA